MCPFDPLPPAKASGIRLGTPGVTTRGMGKEEMKSIAGLLYYMRYVKRLR